MWVGTGILAIITVDHDDSAWNGTLVKSSEKVGWSNQNVRSLNTDILYEC